jgi:hypothetical protein
MTANQFDTSAILNLLSGIAALSAVILAVLSEIRAQKRFKQGNEIQEKIAAANVKPLLGVSNFENVDDCKVVLINHGLGTAIITKTIFSKNNLREEDCLVSVLDVPFTFRWKSACFFEFVGDQNLYLKAGGELDLVWLSRSFLKDQGLPDGTIESIFGAVKSQIKGCRITISYEDVLGNKQKDYDETL